MIFSSLKNERGSIIVIALLVLVLLTLVGIAAMTTNSIESHIVRNDAEYKQEFYRVESGLLEVAWDVDHAGGGGPCGTRNSCAQTYPVLNISQPVLLTTTASSNPPPLNLAFGGNAVPTQVSSTPANINDLLWPTNYAGTEDEYAYRVWYREEGPNPKGYGAGVGSYIFDITVRKQTNVGGNVTTGTVINEGYIKIGPKS